MMRPRKWEVCLSLARSGKGTKDNIVYWMEAEKQLKKTELFLKTISNFNSAWSVGVHLSGGLTMNLNFSSKSCSCGVLDGSHA